MTDRGIAFLAEGKMYLKTPGSAVRLIESQFAQQSADRAQRSQERHAWKSGPGNVGGMLPSGMLWKQTKSNSEARVANIVGVAPGDDNELLYLLDMSLTGGLFSLNLSDNSERRLFHRNKFLARDLSRHPRTHLVATSVRKDDGTANLALSNVDGRNLREITEGDSVDESPRWLPGDKETLVFQSAGVGRNPAGFVVALGPYAIEQLDIDRGDMSTLAEASDFDFLAPQIALDGALWFIRRPYDPRGHGRFSPLKALTDVLLFPFRLARAIVYFCNFFSILFAQKPLLTAGGPERPEANTKSMLLWGKVIDAEKAMKAAKDGNPVSLVPKSWELVRKVGTIESIVARSVLSFDLPADGSVIYSDGSTIYSAGVGSDSPATIVCTGKMIERVISL